jgi:hypothetical protein
MENTNKKKLRRNDQVEDDSIVELHSNPNNSNSKANFYCSLADNLFGGKNGEIPSR